MADKHDYHGNARPQHWGSENGGYIFYSGLKSYTPRLDAAGHGGYYRHVGNGNIYDDDLHHRYTMSTPKEQEKFDSAQDVKHWPGRQYEQYHLRDRKTATQNSNTNDPRSASNEDSNSEHAGTHGCREIFVRFAKQCSMQGPPYIHNASMIYTKVLWVLLLLVAMGVMTFHLYYLIKTYLQFGVKNEINLGFSSLQFPAVTLCNVNPVRYSKLDNMSADFNELISNLNLTNLGHNIKQLPPPPDSRRKKRQASSSANTVSHTILDGIDIDGGNSTFQDPIADLEQDDYDGFDGYGESWEKEGVDSTWAESQKILTDLYATLGRESRIYAGHRIEDMLVSCSFSGKKCYAENFTISTSTMYGNCYTLQYNKWFSRSSGPNGGLELIVFLETDEYIAGIQADSGLHVMIHPQKTMVFPDDEGFAVAGGTHTFISLKMVQVQRLGKPYGNCIENSEFENKYNVLYSRQACQKFCEQRTIHTSCKCRDETKEELNIKMQVTTLKPCRLKDEVKCMSKAYWDFRQDNSYCGCDNPCSDTKHEKGYSFRTWPLSDFEDLLVTTLCYRESAEVCTKLTDKQNGGREQLANDFVKLNIFFEDLNYENITQKPDYADVQFMSDVGGALGLWIGLSVLSIFEVFQLALELLRHFLCCRWRNTVSASRN